MLVRTKKTQEAACGREPAFLLALLIFVAAVCTVQAQTVSSASPTLRLASPSKADFLDSGSSSGIQPKLLSMAAYNSGPQDTPVSSPQAGVLRPAELEKIVPPSVFFQGQSATVQQRNAGGVRFPGGALMFAVRVDTGGYSTGVQERYQAYLVTEAPLRLGSGGGQTLGPGAYGVGFTAAGFLVMDVGGHTLLTVPTEADPGLRRPTPLQVLGTGPFRLYSGRQFITFARADASQ